MRLAIVLRGAIDEAHGALSRARGAYERAAELGDGAVIARALLALARVAERDGDLRAAYDALDALVRRAEFASPPPDAAALRDYAVRRQLLLRARMRSQ